MWHKNVVLHITGTKRDIRAHMTMHTLSVCTVSTPVDTIVTPCDRNYNGNFNAIMAKVCHST